MFGILLGEKFFITRHSEQILHCFTEHSNKWLRWFSICGHELDKLVRPRSDDFYPHVNQASIADPCF